MAVKKVLVTGGAGFIGSWICKILIKNGYKPTVFDNLSTGFLDLVPKGVKVIKGDLRNPKDINKAVRGQDAVIHLAAQAIVPRSLADPQETFDINLAGGQNLLEAMRKHGVKKIVHSSTCAVYGTPTKLPIREDDPKTPISPYGASKLAFEQLLQVYNLNYGLDVVMFRYFNPYGPNEKHAEETHAIPNFIKAVLNDEPAPLYWNGDQKRDFFFVEDIARAHVLGLKKSGFHYYNIGSGGAMKVSEILQKIGDILGKKPKIKDFGERQGDPMELRADITKAKKELRWKPETNIDEGLKQTIEYIKSNKNNDLSRSDG